MKYATSWETHKATDRVTNYLTPGDLQFIYDLQVRDRQCQYCELFWFEIPDGQAQRRASSGRFMGLEAMGKVSCTSPCYALILEPNHFLLDNLFNFRDIGRAAVTFQSVHRQGVLKIASTCGNSPPLKHLRYVSPALLVTVGSDCAGEHSPGRRARPRWPPAPAAAPPAGPAGNHERVRLLHADP